MKTLPPLILKDKYYRYVEQEINRILGLLLYGPLSGDLGFEIKEIRNAVDSLASAVAEGRVWYQGGVFYGSYNSRISRDLKAIGARYDARSKTWTISGPPPADVSLAQAQADGRFNALRKSIISTLDDIDIESINQISQIPDKYMETIDWMEDDFQKTVKAVSIPPKLTAAQRGIITAEWSQNLDLYIKDWTEKNIRDLRGAVATNTFQGNRSKAIVDMIRHNYGVSQRKAAFLARQETSLLMSKFREVRYRDIGSTEYIWRGSMDERERHDHKILEGQVFRWDQPPVVDRKNGRRANPGEDFGCRCVAVAVIR